MDLAPSAYDMIVATLPSTSDLASQYKSPDRNKSEQAIASKVAWQHSKSSSKSGITPLSPRAQGKQAQRNGPLPHESFVILQDSVIRNIPSPTPSPTRTKRNGSNAYTTASPSVKEVSEPLSRPMEQDHANPSPLSHHLRSTARLFNLISSRTDIDHPLCAECTQILLSNLQKKLDETKKERDGYIAFEKEVRKEKEKESHGLSKEETERKIEKLQQEEASFIEQLKEAEHEREQLDLELRQLELNEKALEEEEAE